MSVSHIDCHNVSYDFQNNQRFLKYYERFGLPRETWCEIYRSLGLDAVYFGGYVLSFQTHLLHILKQEDRVDSSSETLHLPNYKSSQYRSSVPSYSVP
jgi:hypothetical protein